MKPIQIYRCLSTFSKTSHLHVRNCRLKEILLDNWRFRNVLVCQNSVRKYSMEEKQKETFLIAGLGNHDLPGTRHSVGMQLVNKLARFLKIDLIKSRDCLGFVGKMELSHIHLVLLKPKQAMNINGPSVYKTAIKHQVPVSNIYLVHDDLDKKVGKVSVKERGSAGGHNGVKSVTQSFKTDEIVRVRIGIDRPQSMDMVVDYVLQKFKSSEKAGIDQAVDQGILKIAQHISAQTGLTTAQIFQTISKSEDSGSSDQSDRKSDDSSDVT